MDETAVEPGLGTGGKVLRGLANPVGAEKTGGAMGLEGTGSHRKTVGNERRLKLNFLKSAAGGVVSRSEILWLLRKDSRKVA